STARATTGAAAGNRPPSGSADPDSGPPTPPGSKRVGTWGLTVAADAPPARRANRSLTAHHRKVRRAPPPGEGKNLRFRPAVRPGQLVDLAQQPSRGGAQGGGDERADVERALPQRVALRAGQRQRDVEERVGRGDPAAERLPYLGRQVRRGH